jgi:hypothetical protein
MFEYKDSYGNGLAILLVLIGVLIDMLFVRCGLAIAAATLLLWPFLHRRFGMTPATTLMLVSLVGLLIGGTWWLIERQSTGSSPNTSSAESSDIPHLKLQFVVERIVNDDVEFHLEVENISSLTVDQITQSYQSTDVSASEIDPILPRTLPPGVKLNLPGSPVNKLVKSRFLNVALRYRSATDGRRFEVQCRFVLPADLTNNQAIDPSQWAEGVITPEFERAENMRLASQFSVPTGMLNLVVPEDKPDGSPNVLNVRDGAKLLVVDFARRSVDFTVTFPTGAVKSIHENIMKMSKNHSVIVTWDQSKQTISLFLDGGPIIHK